jgi:hypothetical protein
LKVGKGKGRKRSIKDMYDTSVCHVKFRKPRIVPERKRTFDQDRELYFDHMRRIRARLQGVVFRDHFAIGFRNIGVSNIEEVSEKRDWPKVAPAQSPKSLIVERDSDWERTWGRDESYSGRWGTARDEDHETVLYPAERIPPQLTYYSKRKVVEDKTKPEWRRTKIEPTKTKETKRRSLLSSEREESKWKTRGSEKVNQLDGGASNPPIEVPPSRIEWIDENTGSGSGMGEASVSPKDKKRAFAFNEYALALMESGQYKRAMTYFQKARNLDPREEIYKTNMNRCQQWLDYRSRGG